MPNTGKNPRHPDSPFVTAEGMARAVPFRQRFPNMDTSTITAVADPPDGHDLRSSPAKQQITVRLSQDVIAALRATGPDWSGLADDLRVPHSSAGAELPQEHRLLS